MFQKLTIGKKIALAMAVVIVVLTVVAALSIIGIGGIVENAGEVIDGNKLRANLVEREVDHLNWANKVNELLTDDTVTELNVQLDHRQCAFGKWLYGQGRSEAEKLVPECASLLKNIEEPHRELHDSAKEIQGCFCQADIHLGAFLQAKKNDHLAWMHKVKDALLNREATSTGVQTDWSKCGLGKWMYSSETSALRKSDPEFAAIFAKAEEYHKTLHGGAIQLDGLLAKGERERASEAYYTSVVPAARGTLASIDKWIDRNAEQVKNMQRAQGIYATQTKRNLLQVQSLLADVRKTVSDNVMTDQQMLAAATGTKTSVTLFSAIGIVAGIALAIFISMGIVRNLLMVIDGLSEGSNQTRSASNQVSASSQSLAEGASEQASSLEEISASLEEMSSMTKQSADNARQANGMAEETREAASRGVTAMERMSGAIAGIKASSDETAKIIKTIDEIAFQTNLLALNAAVEAARAGDAGKGFAVVAEEVRNLAQRSAEAARSTAELIEGSQQSADNGVSMTEEVDTILRQIADSVEKVTQLVGEVTVASNEQAQGIGQVSTAVAEMDKITQGNAANAEESASASEELSSQAEALNDMVGSLAAMAGATTRSRQGAPSASSVPASRQQTAATPVLATPAGTGEPPKLAAPGSNKSKGTRPDQVIPLEDRDFDDF